MKHTRFKDQRRLMDLLRRRRLVLGVICISETVKMNKNKPISKVTMPYSSMISWMMLKLTCQRGHGVCRKIILEDLLLLETTYGKASAHGTVLVLKTMALSTSVTA